MYKLQLPLKKSTFSFPENPLFENLIEGWTAPPAESVVHTICLKNA